MEDNIIDEKISKLVRSIEKSVPAAVEGKIEAAKGSERPSRNLLKRRWPFFLAAIPGVAAVLLGILFLFPLFQKQPEPQISEIRTEFELVDKNIKIIFIQRPNFNLFKED